MEKKSDLTILFKYRGALMGLAALWILATHEWQMISEPDTLLYSIEFFIKRIGFGGVDIFLFLSGMGMVYSLEKNNLKKFYYNRFKRIFVPFWIMAIVVAVIDRWGIVSFLKVITGYAFLKINIYTFLWFVPAIVILYLFVPLYYKFLKKAKNKGLFIASTIEVWLLLSLLLSIVIREDLYGFTNRIPIFVMGVYIGWLCKQNVIELKRGSWIFLIITLTLGLYLAYQTNINGMALIVPVSNCCIPNFLISISISLLFAKGMDVLMFGKHTKIFAVIIEKILSFFGMMSLEFYCVQEWISNKIIPIMQKNNSNAVINIKIWVIVSVFGFLLYMINKGAVRCLDYLCDNFNKEKH